MPGQIPAPEQDRGQGPGRQRSDHGGWGTEEAQPRRGTRLSPLAAAARASHCPLLHTPQPVFSFKVLVLSPTFQPQSSLRTYVPHYLKSFPAVGTVPHFFQGPLAPRGLPLQWPWPLLCSLLTRPLAFSPFLEVSAWTFCPASP